MDGGLSPVCGALSPADVCGTATAGVASQCACRWWGNDQHTAALAALGAIAASAPVYAFAGGTITTFDVPNAVQTEGTSIADDGSITGNFGYSTSGPEQGFVRAPDGTFITFSPKGSYGTYPWGINRKGAVAGIYYDANSIFHGFVRSPKGRITTFDPPGSIYTDAVAINDAGSVTGSYIDSSDVGHGFLRTSDGTITTFDPTGSTGTYAKAINSNGDIAGYYTLPTSRRITHGFLRAADGTITTFDVRLKGTQPIGINDTDTISGDCRKHRTDFGFVRASDGTVKKFQPAGARITTVFAINDRGAVTGAYADSSFTEHGFVRSPRGKITSFDGPNAIYTVAYSINGKGVITGNFVDSSGFSHGFIRTP